VLTILPCSMRARARAREREEREREREGEREREREREREGERERERETWCQLARALRRGKQDIEFVSLTHTHSNLF